MSTSRFQPGELTLLLSQLCDSVMSDEQFARLNELLHDEPEARKYYRRYMAVHATLPRIAAPTNAALNESRLRSLVESVESQSMLREVLEQERQAKLRREKFEAQQDSEREAAEADRRESLELLLHRGDDLTPVRHIVIPRGAVYAAAAALAAMLLVLIYPLWQAAPTITPSPDAPPTPPQPYVQVATVIEETDAQWEGASESIGQSGEVFNRGVLRLNDGLARLRFQSGAEVIMDGPCVIEPLSESELRLLHGQIVGFCEVPESKGFIVQANTARIVDLGTEFGVQLDEAGRPEAHVFRGEVFVELDDEVQIDKGARNSKITAGQSATIDQHEGVIIQQAAPAQFTRTTLRHDQLFARLNRQILADQPLIYYRFDALNGGTHVANLARNDFHASLEGAPDWVRSPFSALRLNPSDKLPYVKVERPLHELRGNSWSVEVWVRVNDPMRAGTIVNLRKQLGASGSYGAIWFEPPNQGRNKSATRPALRVANNGVSVEQAEFFAHDGIKPGQWHHVVLTTHDGASQLYVDGRVVAVGPALPIPESPDALFVGCLRDDSEGKISGWFSGDIAAVAIHADSFDQARVMTRWRETQPLFDP